MEGHRHWWPSVIYLLLNNGRPLFQIMDYVSYWQKHSQYDLVSHIDYVSGCSHRTHVTEWDSEQNKQAILCHVFSFPCGSRSTLQRQAQEKQHKNWSFQTQFIPLPGDYWFPWDSPHWCVCPAVERVRGSTLLSLYHWSAQSRSSQYTSAQENFVEDELPQDTGVHGNPPLSPRHLSLGAL